MEIHFFHWAQNAGHSIHRSFEPLIEELSKKEQVKEYHVPFAGANPIKILQNILFIRRNRSTKGINHITGDIHYGILGLIGVKSVLTIHDDYAWVKARRGFFDKLYKWFLWLYLPIKLANRVICISEATKLKIDRLVTNKKTIVLAHHTFGKGFKFTPLKLNKIKPRILQIGATYQKNLETTIKALQNVKCQLRVIKEMTQEQHLLAKEMKIDYSNAYNLSNTEIIEEYQKADIVVFPSLYEGFGMPIIEAQATGRPVITSNISPMNWVAGEGSALLTDPLDAEELGNVIKRIIEDNGYREFLIEKGLTNVERFNLTKITDKYKSIYSDLLNTKK